MANTEIRNALQYVRKAEEEILEVLKQPGLNQSERDLLDEVSDIMRDLDNLLVKIDLSKEIDTLKEKSEELSKLNKRTNKELKKIKKISEVINKAATAIDALVKAFDILAKAGLM